ncbi:MAG: rhodanese-like domain-containing protein [Acidobacteriota bacterium]
MQLTKSSWRVWGMIGAGAMLFASLACDTSAEKSMASATASPAPVASPVGAEDQDAEAAMQRITAAESITLVKEGKAVVIDVRGTEAYKANHTKGAIDFPLSKLEAGDFTGLPRDKKIIAYGT